MQKIVIKKQEYEVAIKLVSLQFNQSLKEIKQVCDDKIKFISECLKLKIIFKEDLKPLERFKEYPAIKLIGCFIPEIIKDLSKKFKLSGTKKLIEKILSRKKFKKQQPQKVLLKQKFLLDYKNIFSGFKIDIDYLNQSRENIELSLKNMEEDFISQTGNKNLNLSSTKQINNLIANSTSINNKAFYKEFIRSYRGLKTRLSILNRLDKEKNIENRVYPNYSESVTGRVITSKPNIQGLPRDLRDIISCEDGYRLLRFDYSQIELRVLAHLSQDKNLIETFQDGFDIHGLTARNLDISRQDAKTINFAILYGMSSFRLAKKLNITKEEAQKLINNYYRTYMSLHNFKSCTLRNAKTDYFVETISGRKIKVDKKIKSGTWKEQEKAKRFAFNAVIQGSASDIVRESTKKIIEYKNSLKNKNAIKIVANIHDELIFEISKEDYNVHYRAIKNIMQNSIKLSVPLLV